MTALPPDGDAKPAPAARTAWVALVVLTLVNLVNYMDRYVVAGVGESLQHSELHLTDSQFGALTSAFFLVYMCTAPVLGAYGHRRWRLRLVAAGVAAWSVATALAGLAHSYPALLTARASVGIGEAAYSAIEIPLRPGDRCLLYTDGVVEAMSAGVDRPIIFPISNPTSQIEAMPADIIAWSGGKAVVCTGLPIQPLEYAGTRYEFGEANNALLYPGLGLGAIVAGASHVTDGMLLAAAEAVAGQADVSLPGASLLPAVENLRASSATAAIAVARAAAADGTATKEGGDLVQAVQDAMWQPVYRDPAEG